jgi:hypothetical protein
VAAAPVASDAAAASAALQPGWSAALGAGAALAAGAATAQLLCPIDQATHTIPWHLLPVAALAAAAGVAARRR